MAKILKEHRIGRVHSKGRPYYLSVRLSEAEYEVYRLCLCSYLDAEVLSSKDISMSSKFRLLLDKIPKSGRPLSVLESEAVLFACWIRETRRFEKEGFS